MGKASITMKYVWWGAFFLIHHPAFISTAIAPFVPHIRSGRRRPFAMDRVGDTLQEVLALDLGIATVTDCSWQPWGSGA